MVRPAFVFLREDGESHNDAVARCAEQILGPGPMSYDLRRDDHEEFLEATHGRGAELLKMVHTNKRATECAIFVGACLIAAEVVAPHGWPRIPAITTWVGMGGFASAKWIPFKLWTPRRGDIPYWCSGGTEWYKAYDGHVGLTLYGDGYIWATAEGGGGADGTLCRMSDAPKDIRASHGRPCRGAWRPDAVPSAHADTDPAPPPEAP